MSNLIPFIKLFKKNLWWMILGLSLSYATVLSSIGLMSLSGWFISAAAYSSLSYAIASKFNYFLPAAGVRFFSLMRILNRYGERIITHDATFQSLSDIRVWFYSKIEPLAPGHELFSKSGDLLTGIINDIEALDNLYIRVLIPNIVSFLTLIFVFFFFCFFSINIALITILLTFIILFFVPIIIAKLANNITDKIAQVMSELKVKIIEYTKGYAELKLYCQDSSFLEEIMHCNNKLMNMQYKISRYTGIGSAFSMLLFGINIVLVIWFASELVFSGYLNGAFIALLVLAVMAFFELFYPVSISYQYLGKSISSAKRILGFVNNKPEITFLSNYPVLSSKYNIDVKNIAFSYPNRSTPVLCGFSASFIQGEKVALMGPTGCGKSTLLDLLARAIDCDHGSISINGTDIKLISEDELRSSITIISQREYMFSGTLKDNLLIAKNNITDDELYNVIELVGLGQFVNDLKDRLDTWIGEGGCKLSGGQKKRLSLARAFLRSTPIILLDEPTEGLDSVSINKIFHSINTYLKDKLIIISTHDKSFASEMDRIIYL